MQTLTQPKRKHMKKTIKVTDRNGTFTGYVEIIFNHRVEDQDRPIPCTQAKEKYYHIVRANAEHITSMSDEFTNKADAVSIARGMENWVRNHLKEMATQVQEQGETIEESLKKLGYE